MNKRTQFRTFKSAVEATPDIKTGFRDGLKALGAHSGKIIVSNTSKIEGSVNIDECAKKRYPSESRWDYVFAYNGEAFFIEVHPAHTTEVAVALDKLQWLKNWLRFSAPEIQKIQAAKPFHWIQSGKFALLPTSPQYKKAAQAGLLPKPRLTLP